MKGDEERGSLLPKERQSRSLTSFGMNYTAGMTSVSTDDTGTDQAGGTEQTRNPLRLSIIAEVGKAVFSSR
jgi:hypothetical protein